MSFCRVCWVTCAVLGGLVAGTASAGFEMPDTDPVVSETPDDRNWGISIRFFGGYNDNVNLVPDQTFFVGTTDSAFFGISLGGWYEYDAGNGFFVLPTMSIDQTVYFGSQDMLDPFVNDDQSEYNLTVVNPTIALEWRGPVSAYPARVGVKYDFRYEGGPIDSIGLDSHALTFYMAAAMSEQFSLIASYTHAWDDYEVNFPDPDLNDRDGERDVFSLSGRYDFNDFQQAVILTYAFTHNDAEGSNFDYCSHRISGRFETVIFGPVFGAVELGYAWYDYDGFDSPFVPPPGRTEQEVLDVMLQLVWVLDEHWSLDFFYQYQDFDSNTPQFSGDQSSVGGGLTFRY